MIARLTKTKTSSFILATLFFFGMFLLPQLLFAQTPAEGERGWAMAGLQGLLYSIVNVVFGTLAGLAGLLLNEAVETYVVGFGALYQSSGLGWTIDNLWSTVRDIFNLTFIFGLVYIGFKMIFNSGDSSAKRMLGSLVLAALLVNFSLFITKFVIDFSNIAAAQLASGFNNGGNYAVSEGFMNIMGISGLFSTGESLADKTTSAGFAFIFGSLILYIVAAFVFAAGGLLLMIRFVVLNIYMILSPLMFLGMVFPGFSSVSRQYWSGFLSRAFFAPAYILMLYFSHQILVNMRGVSAGTAQMADVFGSRNPEPGFAATIPYFILTAVFMIASLVVAQKMGAQGASSALAIGKRMSGGARKYATNAATYAPRTLGRMGANKAGESATRGLNNLQTRKGLVGWAAKTNIVDKKVRGAATAAAGAKFGTGTTNKENRDYAQKTQIRANQTEAENKRQAEFSNQTKSLTDPLKTADELTTALDGLAKTIKGMSKDEKNGMPLASLIDKNIAVNLSDDDIKNLEGSGNFGASEVQQIKAARKDGFVSIAAAGSTLATVTPPPSGAPAGTPPTITYANNNPEAAAVNQRKSIAGKGTREVGNLPIEIFKEKSMYEYITPAMLEERMRNGVSAGDKVAIRKALDAYLDLGGLTPAEAAAAFPNMEGITTNPWTKWENSNSNYAAQFFA